MQNGTESDDGIRPSRPHSAVIGCASSIGGRDKRAASGVLAET
jgi:hypothetical protein